MAQPRRVAVKLNSGNPEEIRSGRNTGGRTSCGWGSSDSDDDVTVRRGAARHFAARERVRQRSAAAATARHDSESSAPSSDDPEGPSCAQRAAAREQSRAIRAMRSPTSRVTEDEPRLRRAHAGRRVDSGSDDSHENKSRAGRDGEVLQRGVSRAERPLDTSDGEPASQDWRRAAQRRALRSSDRAKRQPTAADHSAGASGSSSSDGRPRQRRAGRERAKSAPVPKGAAERRREWESRRGEDDSSDRHRQTHIHNLSPASPEPFARPSLVASQQWLARPEAKIDAESLEAITREIAMYNHKHWSAGANQLIGSNVEGEERSLLDTLKHLNMNAVARKASFVPLSSSQSERWDPMEPDVSGMERSGINQRTRDGAARTYAPGSLPKVRTAINRWLQYTHGEAHVSCLRPRISRDQGNQFLKECYLKMNFIPWCTLTGCSVRTAEGYFSLIQSWHKDQMGYCIAESECFTDHQFSRVNRGLRRLLPHKGMHRIAHPTSINEPVLRASLGEVLRIYDEGPLDRVRLHRIRLALSDNPSYWTGTFKKELYDDLFYSSLTEFMTDGLLRPSEALPNMKDSNGKRVRSLIHRDDVSFEFGADGKLTKVQVMITPIKQSGSRIGSTEKVPIPVAANRGGTLRSAELLHILTALSPVTAEEAATTPLFRYAKELVEMSAKEKKYHTWISHDRVMRWYRDRARAAGVQHVDLIKMHSFRIGGATAMMAAGISAEEIKTRGRWASDVYQIYCRVCEGRLLEISRAMSNVRTDSFIGRGDSFFSFAAGANKDSPAIVDTEAAGTVGEQADEDELMDEACSDDEEMGEFGDDDDDDEDYVDEP